MRAEKDPPITNISLLTKAIEKVMKQEHMPGLMLSIVTKDSVLFSGGIGYSNLKARTKVNGNTLFHLGSISKMFVALAIQKLVSEGKVSLSDKLAGIAPEIQFKNPWEKTDPVRIINLLEHTAGFDEVHLNKMISPDGKTSYGLDAVKTIQNSLFCRWRPGERHVYANPDYVVLGYLIEKVSGKRFSEYITKNILLPLGMKQTVYDFTGICDLNYATGYQFVRGVEAKVPFPVLSGNGADGSIVSSANDMSCFLRSLLNNWQVGKTRLLPPSFLSEMETVHSTRAAKYGLKMGYGLANTPGVITKNITFRGHGGHIDGFGSSLAYNRELGVGYVISNNGESYPLPVEQLIAGFLTQNLKAQSPEPASNQSLEKFKPLMGYYQLASTHSEMWSFYENILEGITLSLTDGKIVVHSTHGSTDTLYSAGGALFKHKTDLTPTFALGRDKDGEGFLAGYQGYYHRTNYFLIWIQRLLLYLGLLAMVFSVIIGIISLIMVALNKVPLKQTALLVTPALAVIAGVSAFMEMSRTDTINKAAFATFNGTTLFIFLGSLGFGLFDLISLWLLYKHWNTLKNYWIKGPLAFSILFLSYLTVLLMVHGWIGVRIWKL
ncbi:MAG: class A beta-lactamase-related serine hydrolase [Sphingobacteriaceae bacterium]|nr:MAG: class A beta-lactamase-related serine hydrolase [Sphingobacteriaceae bacterium]